MEIGIVGLPNVGKSTLFNALTGSAVAASNFPFTTIEPNVGIVPVRDPRLYKLSEIFHSAKTVPAGVRFVDIAGLVRGGKVGIVQALYDVATGQVKFMEEDAVMS